MNITEVSSVCKMNTLRDEWSRLWQHCGDSVFQHPDWLIPWCRPFGVREPWLLRIERAGRLVGVAPLVIYQRNGERVLTLLGAGVSDDQDVLVEPEHGELAMAAIWRYLAQHRGAWDVFELENLRDCSRLLHSIPVGWEGGELRRTAVRPVLEFGADVTCLEDLHSDDLVKDSRYRTRRAEREQLPVSYEQVNPDNFDRLFSDLARLHRARWSSRGQSGMLEGDLEEFHREAARRLLDDDLLRLHLLALGGRPAAAFYGYHAAGRTVFYLGGFDPELSRFSPGKLVVAHAIDYAITRDGAQYFDFLRGAEAYKYLWGATDMPLYSRTLRIASVDACGGAQLDAA
jgi:CelD/BcsL family acetyltransferase involved in cellulose biosynthesis